MNNKLNIKGYKKLIKELVEYTQREWTGKQGYWTDHESFKYCGQIYTGDFWELKKMDEGRGI